VCAGWPFHAAAFTYRKTANFSAVDDPLDFIDFDDVIQHGDPRKWRYLVPKKRSPTPATSENGLPGTVKHYDLYLDEHGDEIELHYFRYPDGTVAMLK
jgi:hypothetical protein